MNKGDIWDREGLHSEFLRKAQNAITYVEEVRVNAKSNRSYERLHDEALAEFYVYNYLHGRSFLATKGETVAALEVLAATPAPTERVFDSQHFIGHRIRLIRVLLDRFGKRESGPPREEASLPGKSNEL
jgi:hypothetical protein